MPEEEFNIHKFIARIYSKCPFLGYIYSNLDKLEDPSMSTIGVTKCNKLIYNKNFLMSLDIESSQYILLHEALHKMNNHFERAYKYIEFETGKSFNEALKDDIQLMQKLNIAMDIAINQICDTHFTRPDIGIHLDDINDKLDPDDKLEYGRKWEYYYKNYETIKSNMECEEIPDHNMQMDSYIDEDILDEIDGENIDTYQDLFNDIVDDALTEDMLYGGEKAGMKHSSEFYDLVKTEPTEFNDRKIWERVIYNNIGNYRTSKKNYHMKRPSRRDSSNPIGRKYETRSKKCVVVVDTSYSCYDDIPEFIALINRAIKRHKCTIDLILCTSKVYDTYENLKKIDYGKIKPRLGGTDLRRAQEYITDNYRGGGKGINAIFITDGETAWIDKYKYNVSVIYTKIHRKIKGITNYAVIGE